MKKIYSRIQSDQLLHIINRRTEVNDQRLDMTPASESLQVACMRLENGKKFRAHKHITNNRTTTITQETWVVIAGKIKAILYDLDDTILSEEVLSPGDCTITFNGGHNYEVLEADSLVYEFKLGPYLGVQTDKVLI